MSKPMLFIDGKNSLYRAIFANKRKDVHDVTIFMRFLHTWFDKFHPSSIHVFWDAPRNEVWRKKILPTYKDRISTGPDISKELRVGQEALSELLPMVGVRQYCRKAMEADDLIYAACWAVHPHEAVIVSSDGDYTQIPYYFENVKLYEPRLNHWVSPTAFNPVIRKALMGDGGDNIKGYLGIGKVKGQNLAESFDKMQDFLHTNDKSIFIRNMMLIDLSLCPDLLNNKLLIWRNLCQPIVYDGDKIVQCMSKYELAGLPNDYRRIILPLKSLVNNKETQLIAS